MAAVIPKGIPISSHSSRSSFLLTEDSSSHYYLHNEDHPGFLLVPQPLTGENYNSCSRSMMMALSTKNKLMFIDGSLTKPSHLNGPELRAWTRCNDTISYWIVNTVSKEINTSIIYINNL
jgi:hypothetical protein